MKKSLTMFCAVLMVLALPAQMRVKKFNTTSFRTQEKSSSPLLAEKSSPEAKQHPEYALLPYNAQCTACVELIDKRTIDSRLFIDPKNAGHTYSQQSHFPLHYQQSADDIWRTIDPRLQAQGNGVYIANRQPVPTKLDLNRQSTSLTESGFEFEFNKRLSLYFFDDNTLYTQKQPASYANYTVGEEGMTVKDVWPGIEMEQLFTAGQVKTSFIIAAPLQLPITKGWMVVEDHFTLPSNLSIVEEEHGSHTAEGYYRGDYLIKNEKGETLIMYGKPVYLDAKVLGMHGIYSLVRNGNDYTLQMLIPVEWLNKPDNTYPLLIDPTVAGVTRMGAFSQTGQPSASMGFTSMALGACPYTMNVTVPGKSQISNAYVDVEYSLTYDNTCGTPALPPPFCTFSQVSMEVKCDACNTSSGLLSCNPANPPFTGTCTTDSNLVPGASAINITSYVPNYLSCIAPQCPDYTIAFTLYNRDSICGDVCGYLCARGNMWQMTVEAEQDSVYFFPITITAVNDTLFSSQSTNVQWYRNDTLIAGATDSFYIATEPGIYGINITDSLNCGTNTINFNCGAQFTVLSIDDFPWLPGVDSGYYYGLNTSVGDVTYLWDFGDGATSTDPYPTHDYAQPGQYIVCLTVSNILCTDTKCDSSFYVFKTEGGLMTRFTVFPGLPTGISEVKQIASVKLYPNPATNELNIVTDGTPVDEVRIWNVDGKILSSAKRPIGNRLNIETLSKGVYVAEVIIKGQSKMARWIKM